MKSCAAATLCERKTGVMFTPDLVSAPTVSPWAGQGRSGEPARMARSAACLSLRRTTAGPTVLEGDRFGGSVGDG
jgi:hypothetical protein